MQPISSSSLFCQINVAILFADKRKSMKIVIRITVIFGTIAFSIRAFLSWRCMVKHGGKSLSVLVCFGYLEFCNFNGAYSLNLNQKGRGRAQGTVGAKLNSRNYQLYSVYIHRSIIRDKKKVTIHTYMKKEDHILSTQLPLSIAAQGSRATALVSSFLSLF